MNYYGDNDDGVQEIFQNTQFDLLLVTKSPKLNYLVVLEFTDPVLRECRAYKNTTKVWYLVLIMKEIYGATLS